MPIYLKKWDAKKQEIVMEQVEESDLLSIVFESEQGGTLEASLKSEGMLVRSSDDKLLAFWPEVANVGLLRTRDR